MRYQIIGADRDSGEDLEFFIEAQSSEEARQKASKKGILVASCKRAEASKPKPVPVTAVQAPTAAKSKTGMWVAIGGGAVALIAAIVVIPLAMRPNNTNATQTAAPSAPVQPTPVAAPIVQAPASIDANPVKSFETFAEAFTQHAKLMSDAWTPPESQAEASYIEWPKDGQYKINVEKTTSLVSPYIGTLTSQVRSVDRSEAIRKLHKDQGFDSNSLVEDDDFTLKFAAQDGKWVLTTVSVDHDGRDRSADVAPFFRAVAKGVKN